MKLRMAEAATGVLSAAFVSGCGAELSGEGQGLSNPNEYVERCEGESDPDTYFPRRAFFYSYTFTVLSVVDERGYSPQVDEMDALLKQRERQDRFWRCVCSVQLMTMVCSGKQPGLGLAR